MLLFLYRGPPGYVELGFVDDTTCGRQAKTIASNDNNSSVSGRLDGWLAGRPAGWLSTCPPTSQPASQPTNQAA